MQMIFYKKNFWAVILLFFSLVLGACRQNCVEPVCSSCGENEMLSEQSKDYSAGTLRMNQVDQWLQQKAEQGQWFCVLFAEGDTIKLAKGYGCAESCKVKNAPSTIFDLASFTKIFTAIAIMQLQEEGLLSVVDPLAEYFDDLPQDKEEITLQQLLTHSSGLETFHDKRGDFEQMNREKALKRIFRQKLLFEPGTAFNYSNSGFTLLAYIVEDLSQMSFRNYVATEIFDPLDMNRSAFNGDFALERDMAFGYGADCQNENKPGTWPQPSAALHGNGGAISTVEDLFKFKQGIKNNRLIESTSWQDMTKPQLTNTRYEGIYLPEVQQAFGWNLFEHPSLGRITFMGGAGEYGFVSRFRYYEDQNAVLIILMNNFEGSTENAVISESALIELETMLF